MSSKYSSLVERMCQYCGTTFFIPRTQIESNRSPNKGLYCSRQCFGKANRIPLKERFQAKIAPPDANGCMRWTGTLLSQGYGVISDRTNGRMAIKAHRLAYEYANGPIPNGMVVCHACDHPWCVNPEHLFLGTNDDNMADMVRKGRQCRGERVNTAQLTPDDVVTIRRLHASGVRTGILAKRYHIHDSSIRRIVNRTTWRHIA